MFDEEQLVLKINHLYNSFNKFKKIKKKSSSKQEDIFIVLFQKSQKYEILRLRY